MKELLKPAKSKEIMSSLSRLNLHFPITYLEDDEVDVLMNDFLSDMSEYPIDIIEKACADYRKDPNNLYFPKIGRLLGIIKKYWYMRKWKLERLEKLLSVSNAKEQI